MLSSWHTLSARYMIYIYSKDDTWNLLALYWSHREVITFTDLWKWSVAFHLFKVCLVNCTDCESFFFFLNKKRLQYCINRFYNCFLLLMNVNYNKWMCCLRPYNRHSNVKINKYLRHIRNSMSSGRALRHQMTNGQDFSDILSHFPVTLR